MKRLILISLAVFFGLSCSDENPVNSNDGTGAVVIQCMFESEKPARAVALNPTIKADISFYDAQNTLLVKQPLTVEGKRITGTVKVKAGSGYHAEMNCYDKDNKVTHNGTSSNISITAGKQTTVTILLKPALPDTPTAVGPQSVITSGTSYTVSWDAVSRAQSYTIEESTDSSFSGATSKTIVGTSELFTKTVSQTYYYRVKANNTTGSGGWSNTVTVSMSQAQYTLTLAVNTDGWGTTNPSIGAHTYDGGTTVTIKATPASGYWFDHWTGSVTEASNATTTVTVNGNMTITANFIKELTAPEITFVSIPGGTFQMGDVEGGGESDEKPVHNVTVSPFDMSAYEITNLQYAVFLNKSLHLNNVTATDEEVRGNTGSYTGHLYLILSGSSDSGNRCWISYGSGRFSVEPGKENLPVVNVTWDGAKVFAEYYDTDLPREAEWEYASRSGKQYQYGTSDGTISTTKANYESHIGSPKDVGSYPKNPFGLYDMSGNVYEWCNDWYGSYSSSNETDPEGPSSGDLRVVRGGCWNQDAGSCRSANRYSTSQADANGSMGFRVVKRTGGTVTPTKYTLTMAVNNAEWGTTNPSAGAHAYNENTTVTVTATPAQGYRFVNWTGDVADAGNSTTSVTMSGDKTVTANFERIEHALILEVKPSGSGTTSPSEGTHAYGEGTVVTIKATPAQGYLFVNWTGDVADTGNSTTTVTMDDEKHVTANFQKIPESTEIIMIPISGGTFQMGQSGVAEPVHTVTLSSFEMGKYEVTQGQYKSIIGTNPSNFTGDDTFPVEQVSWFDAIKFCNALSTKEGLDKCYDEGTGSCDFTKNGYRLPTEAEWEYACRAGTTTPYYTGTSESDLANAGWYSGNSENRTHPAGRKTPNAWGLYDMHGNVWEWCNDWYGSYRSTNENDPVGPETGSNRIGRGGSWYANGASCHAAFRNDILPNTYDHHTGFRVVRGAHQAAPVQYTLNMRVNTAGWGTIEPAVGTHTYDEGTVVTVTATPAQGYQFANWTGTVADASSASTTVTVSGNMTVTANFEVIPATTEVTMVSIPGGTYQMGLSSGAPTHTVTLTGFEMSKYEVTQGQYQKVLGYNPSDSFGGVGDTYPVYKVTWWDAIMFCNALSVQSGLDKCYDESTGVCDFSKNGYRLPTEAEWEYACRAGSGSLYYYTGSSTANLSQAGWYSGNSNSKVHPVGEKVPNDWGLYDTHGNVWEWCNDWYDSYPSESVTDPTGPETGTRRIYRGGCWVSSAEECRSYYRKDFDPNEASTDIGFRVVRKP
ncbi:SUMF1/EgtB/PvdO family nonheme iron enzyme [bacterium]|nr:SUMF1/EgtB/PvdO family nonheme iron enzyme [bacterium]